ncbi:MAG: hypothetical protein K0U47_03200 [Epsilonproteobacteria bacterium]|nr:hypothetical protein [Campylobacterota bacterium]
MSAFIKFIEDNNLTWQFTLKGETSIKGHYGYRGALVITEGKFLAADKQLPPKATAKQVIAIAEEEKLKFFAAELVTMDDFEPMMQKYKDFFDSDTVVYLFIIDIDKAVTLNYNGTTIHAIQLDESSVWNELLDIADLEKSELKRLKLEEKTDTLVAKALKAKVHYPEVDLAGFKALQTNDAKTNFGAV